MEFSRRDLIRASGAAVLGGGLLTVDTPTRSVRAFSSEVPPDIGQTDLQVFIARTGHTLRGSILDYWRANGAAAVYGDPISEPFDSWDGYYSQAFERAIFQYRPEFLDTEDPIYRLQSIGETALDAAIQATSADLTSQPLSQALVESQTALADDSDRVASIVADGGQFFSDTGHTISGGHQEWYDRHEGGFYLGDPITEPVYDGIGLVQYFVGGVLRQERDGEIALVPIVESLASALGLDLTPVAQGDLPDYDPALFQTAENPAPSGDEATPGRHWVEISLADQQLWAYQGTDSVLTTPISSGLSPNDTLPGLFHVRLKFPSQTMQGFTGETGEVVSFGTTAPSDDAKAYKVKDVPNVMYFSLSAEALHGCYWHENFGNPMSHGCINLPLDVAAWMYGWAPLGTMVWIHE